MEWITGILEWWNGKSLKIFASKYNLHFGLNSIYMYSVLVYDNILQYSYSSAEWLKADEE